jgi:hypothetical protein
MIIDIYNYLLSYLTTINIFYNYNKQQYDENNLETDRLIHKNHKNHENHENYNNIDNIDKKEMFNCKYCNKVFKTQNGASFHTNIYCKSFKSLSSKP